MSSLTISKYSVSQGGVVTKSPSIDVMFKDRNAMAPICYLRKPKWLTDKQWKSVVASIRIDATTDLLEDSEAVL